MKTILIAGLLASAALAAPLARAEPARVAKASAWSAASDATVRGRADALIAKMTIEEKAGQLGIVFAPPYPPMMDVVNRDVANGLRGAVLFVSDAKEANRLQRLAVEKSRLKIPLLLGFDVIHGMATIFPVPIANAASWDPKGVEDAQAIAAKEARAIGIHLAFAPMVDIARDPRWGRIVEGAGEDPFLGSVMAAAQVRGFQGAGIGSPDHIISGPKHFLGYGAALGGRDYDEANIGDAELWNVYIPPFKAAIDAGAGNIMTAYMPLNGIPATGNRGLLEDILRGKLGFKGFVVSDSDAVKNLKTHGLTIDDQDSAARALKAGVDLEMAITSPANGALPAALATGQVTERELDDAVRRVLEAKIRLGLFENPMVDEARAAQVLSDPTHLAAARTAAERSAVLLRNEGDLLPLNRAKLTSIAVIGPLADAPRDLLGPWVFAPSKAGTSSILAGIKAKVGPKVQVSFSPGVAMPKRLNPSPFAAMLGDAKRPEPAGGDAAGIAEAADAAARADVAVLVLGEAQDMIGESASRSTLTLPGRQQELLDKVVATGKPVVVLLVNGRPLTFNGDGARSILDIWYPGSDAGVSTANLLFGDVVPGGKLPFTWPRDVGQVPLIYAHAASHEPAKAEQRYWNDSNAPAYPFGFGLSYSSFAYSNLKLDRTTMGPDGRIEVSVDLSNTGQRTADEVAQLYVHQKTGTAVRPVRELKGFQRVTLGPGERRSLTFTLAASELKYWNAQTKDFVIDESAFDLGVGGDSTVALSAGFTLTNKSN